jgi:hypothetical protein
LYEGWTSWADWLGTTTIATNKRQYRSYDEAKAFVHGLELKSANEWRVYTKSGNLPKDIPVAPYRCYSSKGWTNWADWLGTGTIAYQLREYLPFDEGRALVRTLGLKSKSEWDAHAGSGRLPPSLPRAPHLIYADAGWSTWGDWLGSGTIAPHLRKYRSYHAAKSFVRSLALKSANEWRAYTKSGNLPKDIPACPNQSYSSKGWMNWEDWLGYSR